VFIVLAVYYERSSMDGLLGLMFSKRSEVEASVQRGARKRRGHRAPE